MQLYFAFKFSVKFLNPFLLIKMKKNVQHLTTKEKKEIAITIKNNFRVRSMCVHNNNNNEIVNNEKKARERKKVKKCGSTNSIEWRQKPIQAWSSTATAAAAR